MTIATLDDRRQPRFELRHRLELAREVAEMDQTALAEALGMSRQTVSNYERGATTPRRAVLLAWAMATGVDAKWLEAGDEAPNPVGPAGIEPTTSTVESWRLAPVVDMFAARAS